MTGTSRWVDLTRPLVSGMPVFPGDPQVSMSKALSCATDGVDVTALSMGSHSGTHLDAPSHTVTSGRTVDQVLPGELIGETVILGFAGLEPDERIELARMAELLSSIQTIPSRVFIWTGWDERFDDETARLHHPVVSVEAAQLLWSEGVRLLGVDTLNPDPTVQHGDFILPVHDLFLGGDGMIVENLTRLERLDGTDPGVTGESARQDGDWWSSAWVSVLPLPLSGRDGAPCRVVAVPDVTEPCRRKAEAS